MFDMFDAFKDIGTTQSNDSSGSSSTKSSPVSNDRLFVISIGGSAVVDGKPNTTLMAKLGMKINELFNNGYRFAIVVGGGKIARDYVAAAKNLGANNFVIDQIAIKVTRANALLMVQSLEKSYPEVVESINKAREIIDDGRIPVYGGLTPGFTTDTVAALLTEFLGGRFINLTNVDGIYDRDPKKSAAAKRFDTISHDQLARIISRADARAPGTKVVLDSFTCAILRRSKIPAFVAKADEIENFEAIVRGNDFNGTKILDETAEIQGETSSETRDDEEPEIDEVDY